MAQISLTGIKLESEAIDELRQPGETNAQVVTRVVHAAARPGMVGKYRRAEKAKVDLDALDVAEQTAREARSTAEQTAETTADAAVAAKLGS